MKFLFLINTPREAITLAPVVRGMRRDPEHFQASVWINCEQRERLDSVLATFEIEADHEVSIPTNCDTPAVRTARMMEGLDAVLADAEPDWLVVQGDGTTAMVGTLVAYYRRVRVAHIEAGMRTHDKYTPYPEEMNRRVTDLLADLYFAPTENAQTNLIDEGVDASKIIVTGNTGIDALHHVLQLDCDFSDGPLANLSWDKKILLVATRTRESISGPLEDICSGLLRIAKAHPDAHIVYTSRFDPLVQASIHETLGDLPNVTLAPTLPHVPFVHLMNRSHIVLTDAGGIHEDASCLGKPVLLLDVMTERLEALSRGTARVVGTDEDEILKEAGVLLSDPSAYETMARPSELYGDGRAAKRICYEFQRISGRSSEFL